MGARVPRQSQSQPSNRACAGWPCLFSSTFRSTLAHSFSFSLFPPIFLFSPYLSSPSSPSLHSIPNRPITPLLTQLPTHSNQDNYPSHSFPPGLLSFPSSSICLIRIQEHLTKQRERESEQTEQHNAYNGAHPEHQHLLKRRKLLWPEQPPPRHLHLKLAIQPDHACRRGCSAETLACLVRWLLPFCTAPTSLLLCTFPILTVATTDRVSFDSIVDIILDKLAIYFAHVCVEPEDDKFTDHNWIFPLLAVRISYFAHISHVSLIPPAAACWRWL